MGTDPLRLDVVFPSGAVGSFVVPNGLRHVASFDDEGHVAMVAEEDLATATLDVYSRAAPSADSDLRDAAAAQRAGEKAKGGVASAVHFRTLGGLRTAQYTVEVQGKYADQHYEQLVTVLMVGDQVLATYWGDHHGRYVSARAHRDTAALISSFRPVASDAVGKTGDNADGTA